MMKITLAYCVELDRIVTIDEARIEYLSLPPPRPSRFRYYCSNPDCRQLKVLVSGVNDHKPIKEGKAYRTPHFRRLGNHPHALGCPWDEAEQTLVKKVEETTEDFQRRLARAKLTDFIDIFIPPSLQDEITQSSSSTASTPGRIDQGARQRRNPPQTSSVAGLQRTTVLDRLVNTYIESRKLAWTEQRRLMLQVQGAGSLRLVDYFVRMERCTVDTQDRVIYGGATLEQRYGEGALFHFYSRPKLPHGRKEDEEMLVKLYISPKLVASSHLRHYFNDILSSKDAPPYYNLYALGRLEYNPKYRSASLKIEDLRQLSILHPPEKKGSETNT